MNYLLKPITMILAAAAALCCGSPAGKDARESLARASAEGKFYYAHQDDPSYGHSWRVEDPSGDPLDRSDVFGVCGQYPSMLGFDLGELELGGTANLDGVSFELMRRAAKKQAERGGLVTISWHARNPLTGGDAWDVSSDKVVESVLEGGEKHGEFVAWLDAAAEFLKSFGGIPVLFRPWHENLGSWFWWGGKLCTTEQYKALWRLTYERLKDVDNLLWVYSPNGDYGEQGYIERYPGDDIVDIVGFDSYQSGPMPDSRERYIREMQTALDIVSRFASAHGKLYCVSETGYEGIPDPKWWTSTLLPAMEGYSPCYVLTWRNAWDRPGHYYAPWPGSPDAEDFIAFAAFGKVKLLDK